MRRTTKIFISTLFLSALLSGCGNNTQAPPRGPSPVEIITVAPERLVISRELPGRLEANRTAQVRARVPGVVLKRTFVEGSEVKAGQLLFRIDPAAYNAALSRAKAALARAEANLKQAALRAHRYEPLVKINAISKQEYDETVATKLQAEAEVASAKAAVKTATLDLDYANVSAPISGKIGRAMVTEGALVGQGEATLLALIQEVDSLYVNLTQSSMEVMQLKRALQEGQLAGASKNEIKVKLTLEDGTVYPHAGKLLFSDITVDESTGMVILRAHFPNPERLLMPGAYVRASFEQAVNENAIAVPQQAVLRNVKGPYVLVVGKEDKVESRPVQTADTEGNRFVITSGLEEGDRVIVEGVQKIRVGVPVKPIEWKSNLEQGAEGASDKEPDKPQSEGDTASASEGK